MIKDLGDLIYFLGVKAIPTIIGLFLSQQRYILDLLDKIAMNDARTVAIPMKSTTILILMDGTP